MSISLSKEIIEQIEKHVLRGLEPLYAPPPLRLSEWADEHFYLSAESSGVEGAWETRPYQKAIMNAISNDDIPTVTWMKSARVGYTKCIMAAVGYFAEHKSRNQLIYQPTDGDAEDFVKDEVDPTLRDVPAVRNKLRADPEKRSKFNTASKKSFNGSILDIKGGKSARNYRRMTKDVVYYDELDGFDSDIDNEGSPTTLGDMRLTQSSFPKSVRGSTPSIAGTSKIAISLSEADMVFERHLPCPHCGDHILLKWSNMKWDDSDYRTTYYAAQCCGGQVGYSDYAQMDANGVWKTVDGEWIDEDDMFRDAEGSVIDPPSHIGFKIWAAYSYDLSWPKMVSEFIKAMKSKKDTGDITKLKTFINTRLGECWEEIKGDKDKWVKLKARAEPYNIMEVPLRAAYLSMGVDTQDDRLAVIIDAWGEGDERWTIWWGELYGDPAEKDVWTQLDNLIQREYAHVSGHKLMISDVAIDSGGHRTQSVYNYCRGKRNVIAIKGMNTAGKPVIGRPSYQDVTIGGKVVKSGVKLWPVGSDTAKSMIYARLDISEKGPGYHHFPLGFEDEFYEQLCGEAIITKYKNGMPYEEWVKVRARQEALDCAVYSYAAAVKGGLNRMKWANLYKDLESAINETNTAIKEIDNPYAARVIKSNNPYLG